MTELKIDGDPVIRKVDGRSKEARLSRAAARPEPAAPRTQRAGRMEARGRDGQVLSRTTIQTTDEFEIPKHLMEKDWDYQWVAVSVAGDNDICLNMLQEFEANGWRAVPASRFPGRFMKNGTASDAAIVRKGQMLMERPMSLTDEAKAEEYRKAVTQMKDRDQSLMGRNANLRGNLAPGFEMGGKYRGTGGDLRMSIDSNIDAPRPQHKLAEPGE